MPYGDLITYLTRGSCNEKVLFIQSFHLIYTATFVTVSELVKRHNTITVKTVNVINNTYLRYIEANKAGQYSTLILGSHLVSHLTGINVNTLLGKLF